VDFFCGAGGLSCGFRQVGIKVMAGIDIEPKCQATYEANFPEAAFLCADVSSAVARQLFGIDVTRGDDNLIFAGCSPCQYWSKVPTARTHSGSGKALLRTSFVVLPSGGRGTS